MSIFFATGGNAWWPGPDGDITDVASRLEQDSGRTLPVDDPMAGAWASLQYRTAAKAARERARMWFDAGYLYQWQAFEDLAAVLDKAAVAELAP